MVFEDANANDPTGDDGDSLLYLRQRSG